MQASGGRKERRTKERSRRDERPEGRTSHRNALTRGSDDQRDTTRRTISGDGEVEAEEHPRLTAVIEYGAASSENAVMPGDSGALNAPEPVDENLDGWPFQQTAMQTVDPTIRVAAQLR